MEEQKAFDQQFLLDRHNQSGNIIFVILLAVILFAGLSYVVSGSSSNNNLGTPEAQQLSSIENYTYTANLNVAIQRLEARGCLQVDYTPPSDQTPGNKSCHLFHPDGGGIAYKGVPVTSCNLNDLSLGELCGNTMFAGTLGVKRLYTKTEDLGSFSWNNGTGQRFTTGTTSKTDGKANTDVLVSLTGNGSPYQAAQACRSLGEDWYLPSTQELQVLYSNRATIGGFTPESSSVLYWSSVEAGSFSAMALRTNDGGLRNQSEGSVRRVRCIMSN